MAVSGFGAEGCSSHGSHDQGKYWFAMRRN
jgi:hypothetical protein